MGVKSEVDTNVIRYKSVGEHTIDIIVLNGLTKEEISKTPCRVHQRGTYLIQGADGKFRIPEYQNQKLA